MIDESYVEVRSHGKHDFERVVDLVSRRPWGDRWPSDLREFSATAVDTRGNSIRFYAGDPDSILKSDCLTVFPCRASTKTLISMVFDWLEVLEYPPEPEQCRSGHTFVRGWIAESKINFENLPCKFLTVSPVWVSVPDDMNGCG